MSHEPHWYGERLLNADPAPIRATGLIIKRYYEKDQVVESMFDWIRQLFGLPIKCKYFIIIYITGTYDYGYGRDSRCGARTWKEGYYHFNTEAERDTAYAVLSPETS